MLRAQQDGKILQYLKKDLIAEGIDPDAVVIDSNPQKSKEPLEQSLGDYFDILSDHLDAEAYGPFYDANSGSFEKSLGEKITDYKTFRKINNSLKSLKVAAFLGSIFCALYSISQFMTRRPLKGAIYGLMAYDLVRVSYNCYIKKYCSITANKLGGDFSKLGSTIFQVAQSALGMLLLCYFMREAKAFYDQQHFFRAWRGGSVGENEAWSHLGEHP